MARIIFSHKDHISDLKFLGSELVVGDNSGVVTIRSLFDITSPELVKRVKLPDSVKRVLSIKGEPAVLADKLYLLESEESIEADQAATSDRYIAISKGDEVIVYDLDLNPIRRIKLPSKPSSIDVAGDILGLIYGEKYCFVSIKTGERRCLDIKAPTAIRLSPTGHRLAASMLFGRVLLLQLEGLEIVKRYVLKSFAKPKIEFFRDFLLVASGDRIEIYDLLDPEKPLGVFFVPEREINAIDLSPDGRLLAVAQENRIIILSDVALRAERNYAPITTIALDSEGKVLAYALEDYIENPLIIARLDYNRISVERAPFIPKYLGFSGDYLIASDEKKKLYAIRHLSKGLVGFVNTSIAPERISINLPIEMSSSLEAKSGNVEAKVRDNLIIIYRDGEPIDVIGIDVRGAEKKVIERDSWRGIAFYPWDIRRRKGGYQDLIEDKMRS